MEKETYSKVHHSFFGLLVSKYLLAWSFIILSHGYRVRKIFTEVCIVVKHLDLETREHPGSFSSKHWLHLSSVIWIVITRDC